MCVAAEKKTKEIEATIVEPVAVGDEVEVTGTQRMQLTAVLLAYVLPFLILVGMMFVLSRFTQNEVVVGTVSLACLVPYLILLKLLSPRLKRSLVFFVRPTR
jgi:positive regulator of sigma E activity